ncbi:hypothetical protein GJAV_G00260770 [Gymnothorax javanicus]|nr:hypothetical protein GJAV_G00260770 [Gymnothorax javanicus]
MEFACGFVYVPPQQSSQKPKHAPFKRSALLPPLKIRRPQISPPPPPTSSKKTPSPPGDSPEQKIVGLIRGSDDQKSTETYESTYENSVFFVKAENSDPVKEGPVNPSAHLSSPAYRKALLPPPMKALQLNTTPLTPVSPPLQELNSNSEEQGLTYDLPREEPEIGELQSDAEYTYSIPEGSGIEQTCLINAARGKLPVKSAPPLPPRPSFMNRIPQYLTLLPHSATSSTPAAPKTDSHPPAFTDPAAADDHPLPGIPNVILVPLGTLMTEENVQTMQGIPTTCSQCGSAVDSCYDNMVDECYFCQPWDLATPPANQINSPPMGCQDCLFLLNPDEPIKSPAEPLIIFCIDISGSMCITTEVSEGELTIYMSRLQCVQQAVVQCIYGLSETKPQTRVGLITFDNQVALFSHREVPTRLFSGAELVDRDYLREAALSSPSPLSLSETREHLQTQILSLKEGGATALGPAALIAVTIACQEPGSKVVICTDGKANTELGNLDVDDCHTLTSSSIFYQDLGECAVKQGSGGSVSVVLRGTDCRLDELGRLADRTGGKVVIASPNKLHTELQQVLESRIEATHCSVTLFLPKSLTVKGEREQGHKGTREVGNVTADNEITFQFRARDQHTQSLLSVGSVSVQLHVRYRRIDGLQMLRVLSVDRKVTTGQLNLSQSCAALAVRGRYKDAQSEADIQKKLMERAVNHIRSSEVKQKHNQWVEGMDNIYNNMEIYKRNNSHSMTDSQPLTDTGAALLYGMKNGNRKSISRTDAPKANQR